mmetsp:Transcript_43045/g.93731  ORF Transcript_43045/g.93731 Transcript_43045/m.93731 type:complete len:206 (+) Transcript_43045:789-1406(+)
MSSSRRLASAFAVIRRPAMSSSLLRSSRSIFARSKTSSSKLPKESLSITSLCKAVSSTPSCRIWSTKGRYRPNLCWCFQQTSLRHSSIIYSSKASCRPGRCSPSSVSPAAAFSRPETESSHPWTLGRLALKSTMQSYLRMPLTWPNATTIASPRGRSKEGECRSLWSTMARDTRSRAWMVPPLMMSVRDNLSSVTSPERQRRMTS